MVGLFQTWDTDQSTNQGASRSRIGLDWRCSCKYIESSSAGANGGRTGCQWLTQAATEPGSNIDPTFSTMWDFFPSTVIISFHKLVLFSFLHLNIVPSDWWFICLALLTQALQERGTEEQINQKLYRMEQYKWKNDNDTSFWKRMIKMDRKTDDRVNIGQSASGRWNGRVFQKLNLSQNVACVRFVEPKIPHDLLGWGTKGIFWPIIHSGLPW